jgi:hypothetical protein
MSESGHKRKRSLQDSRVDLSKMRMALNRLDALREELERIEETEEEMQSISDHVLALENILRGAKKPVCIKLLLLWAVVDDAPESDILERYI